MVCLDGCRKPLPLLLHSRGKQDTTRPPQRASVTHVSDVPDGRLRRPQASSLHACLINIIERLFLKSIGLGGNFKVEMENFKLAFYKNLKPGD